MEEGVGSRDAGVSSGDGKNECFGLYLPGKERLVFRPTERKSLLGLDVLASAKREESKVDGGFRVPKDRFASFVSSIHEEEKCELFRTNEDEDDAINGARISNRHYVTQLQWKSFFLKAVHT